MDTQDYIKIFEQSSDLLVVIDTNFAIVAASDSFLASTSTARENIVGCDIFEVFPYNPEDENANGESIIRASFDRVIKNKTKETLPVIKYDIPKPESRGGGFDVKYWQATNSPLLDQENNVKYIVQRAVDATENKTLITQLEYEKKALKLVEDSEKRYNMMLMQSPFAFAILKGENKVITFANDKMKATWGKGNNVEGKPLIEVLPELKDTPFPNLLDKVHKTGIPYHANDVLAPKYTNGQKEDVYYNFVYQPYREADETISGVTIIAAEVTAAVKVKKALEAQHEVEQKALKQIEDSEKRYNMMLIKSPFAFAVLKGKNMVITLANDSVKEMWGKGKDLEGKPLLEVLPEIKDTEFPDLLDKVYTTGTPFSGEELLAPVFRNGKMEDVYFNFVYQPYLEADETISGVTVIAYEVTKLVLAHKKIAESEVHFRQLTDLMPSKVSTADPAGNVVYFNQHWLDYTGYNFEELRDSGYHKMIHPDELNAFQKRLKKAGESGAALKMEMRFMNKVGDYRWHLNIASPIKDGNGDIKMWVGSTTDIHEQKTVSEKIKASEERFRLLVMQAPVAICVLRGEEYIIETINENMLEMWDRTKDETINRPVLDVLPEFRAQGLKKLLDNVYHTGNRLVSQELPLTINRNGGLEHLFVKFVYEPMREADGSVSGIMVLAHEITEQVNARKGIEVSEKKFRLLTNAMPQKITNADADGNVIFFNQQWLDDTGLTFEELKDWGWEKAMHPNDLEPTLNNWKHSVSTGDIFDMECRIQNKEGGYRWNLSRAVPIKDETGKIMMWVGSNTDIHELKEAKSKAESAMKAKQLFLSNMSHEIRTPMNAVIGFTNVILKTDLTAKQKEYINAIKVSGDALIVLINDILDIAKVDAGKMTFEQAPFAFSTSIAATLHLFEPKIQEKNLELIEHFDAAIPEILLGDSVRLRQIILNLLSNAVKFTDSGKITVSVRIFKEEEDNVTIEFSVTDTGIGIPENKLEHIFDDFQQATNETSRLHGGTGLGLSIVKQLVELQGGTLIVNSEPGKGSTFGFILNFKKAIKEPTEISETNSGVELAEKIENIRILVAEDMPLNQLLIKIILKDFGFEVDIADNGQIAIEKLQENRYDIILMDLQMPELNGFKATEYIRQKMNSQIPIIALTADVTTVDLGKCEAVGMNDYISKPIDEKLLYSKIIKHLKKTIDPI